MHQQHVDAVTTAMIAADAERIHAAIKSLNKKSAKAKNKAEKDLIELQVKSLKAEFNKWWS